MKTEKEEEGIKILKMLKMFKREGVKLKAWKGRGTQDGL